MKTIYFKHGIANYKDKSGKLDTFLVISCYHQAMACALSYYAVFSRIQKPLGRVLNADSTFTVDEQDINDFEKKFSEELNKIKSVYKDTVSNHIIFTADVNLGNDGLDIIPDFLFNPAYLENTFPQATITRILESSSNSPLNAGLGYAEKAYSGLKNILFRLKKGGYEKIFQSFLHQDFFDLANAEIVIAQQAKTEFLTSNKSQIKDSVELAWIEEKGSQDYSNKSTTILFNSLTTLNKDGTALKALLTKDGADVNHITKSIASLTTGKNGTIFDKKLNRLPVISETLEEEIGFRQDCNTGRNVL